MDVIRFKRYCFFAVRFIIRRAHRLNLSKTLYIRSKSYSGIILELLKKKINFLILYNENAGCFMDF